MARFLWALVLPTRQDPHKGTTFLLDPPSQEVATHPFLGSFLDWQSAIKQAKGVCFQTHTATQRDSIQNVIQLGWGTPVLISNEGIYWSS